jgi:hypothetical protein
VSPTEPASFTTLVTVSVADQGAVAFSAQVFGEATEDAVLAIVPTDERNVTTVIVTTMSQTTESAVTVVAVAAGSKQALEANVTAAVCAGTITCDVRFTYHDSTGRRRLLGVTDETMRASVNRTFTLAAIQAPAALDRPPPLDAFPHAPLVLDGRVVTSRRSTWP